MKSQHEADKQLAEAVSTGDRGAFDRFFRDYFPRLFRFAMGRLSGDADLAKDMVQQAMIKSVRSISDYRGDASLFTWMCQLCRSEISAHRRKETRRGQVVAPITGVQGDFALESVADDESRGPQQQSVRADQARSVHELLDSLPGEYGEVLELKYVQGCSVDEIASRLQTGTTAVQSMLARARKAFKSAAEASGLGVDK